MFYQCKLIDAQIMFVRFMRVTFFVITWIAFCKNMFAILINILQNYLRNQNNKANYNLVCETLQFLDCICGSTTGGLGLLGLYINESNVALINQTLESLTEYCQGPCHENQVWIGFDWKFNFLTAITL